MKKIGGIDGWKEMIVVDCGFGKKERVKVGDEKE